VWFVAKPWSCSITFMILSTIPRNLRTNNAFSISISPYLYADRTLSQRHITGDITSAQVHEVIKDNNQCLQSEWATGSDVLKTGLEASTELALQQWYKVFDAKVERMKAHYIELEEGALHAQVSKT